MIPVTLLVTMGVFALARISPADPAVVFAGEDRDPAAHITFRAGTTLTGLFLDSREVARRPLQFVSYFLRMSTGQPPTQHEALERLRSMGFPVSEHARRVRTIEEVSAFLGVTPQDLMRIHRDSYEGTEFDMTKGLAAGPFGNPNRWAGSRAPQGHVGWERTISIFRCSYGTVIQSRGWLPPWIGGLVWFAEDDPKTSVYMPLYAGVTTLPESIQTGTRDTFDRKSAWWAFDFVSNWANPRYDAMSKDIRAKGDAIEKAFFDQQAEVEKKAVELFKEDPQKAREYLTSYTGTMVQKTVDEWWKFADYMVVRYNDGYINENGRERSPGYPKEWLDAVGFGKTKVQGVGEKK